MDVLSDCSIWLPHFRGTAGGAGLDPIARSESCSLEAAEVELVGSNICVGQTVFVLSLIKTAGLEPLLLLHLITAA